MQPLHLDDVLPLTCSREGMCCMNATVLLTPWEVAVLADGMGMSTRAFRDQHTQAGGTRLRFADGPGDRPCTLYNTGLGCRAHSARPLACRLFPLGRTRQDGESRYHHPARAASCAELCPRSQLLPRLRVADYLAEQRVANAETAHDAYAGILAAIIATTGEITRRSQRELDQAGLLNYLEALLHATPDVQAARMPAHCLDLLTTPACTARLDDPVAWVTEHRQLLATAVSEGFGLASIGEIIHVMLTMAYLLAPVLGTDPHLIKPTYTAHAQLAAA